MVIENARYVVAPTRGLGLKIYEHTDIVIEDGLIRCIGGHDECRAPRGALRIDAGKHIVVPAMINTHTHVAMYYLKGSLPDHEFWEWLPRIMSIEEKTITPRLVYMASRAACIEQLFNGIIGFIDMYYHPVETAKACTSLGMTVATGPSISDLEKAKETLSELRRIDRVKPILNIHSLYYYEEEVLRDLMEYALENNLAKHIHVSETRREVYQIRKKTGKWPVEYMYMEGWLDNKTILVHLNWVMSHEIEYIAAAGSMVSVCPHTSMRLAEAGFTPIYEMLEKNIALSVGTDGSSGDRFSILEEIRDLILLYRHNYWDTRLKTTWVYPRIIVNGYRMIGLGGGYIEEGEPANIAVLRINPVRHRPITKSNVVSILLLTGGFYADYVIADGEVILGDDNRDKLLDEVTEISGRIEEEVSGRIDYYGGRILEEE